MFYSKIALAVNVPLSIVICQFKCDFILTVFNRVSFLIHMVIFILLIIQVEFSSLRLNFLAIPWDLKEEEEEEEEERKVNKLLESAILTLKYCV